MNESTHKEIALLCEKGDEFAGSGDYQQAIGNYKKALELIPDPYDEYEASTWVLVAIADAHYLETDFENAIEYLQKSLFCPGALENPFVHLRLGQSYFELGKLDKGGDELARAYMLEGIGIFNGTHPKYLEFLKTRIQIDNPVRKHWWKFW